MSAKVLKVAVTQGKKILEQKLITERTSVSVGTAASNTLTVTGGDLPATYTLFELVGGKYCLNFTEKMTGKVNVGAGQLDFETARQQTGVRKRGNEYQMVLSEASKGAHLPARTTQEASLNPIRTYMTSDRPCTWGDNGPSL